MAGGRPLARLEAVPPRSTEGNTVFVALRDIRFAKGRFTLMGAVVALLTGLVLFLYGLTGGLASDSTSALTGLPARHVVFGGPAVSFSDSAISPGQQAAWQAAAGARPFGVSMTRLAAADVTSVSVVGVDPALAPPPLAGRAPGPGDVAVGAELAAEHALRLGQQVWLGAVRLTISGITPNRSWGHAATVWTDEPTWQHVAGATQPVALLVEQAGTDAGTGAGSKALDAAQHTRTVTLDAAEAGIDGYSAEQGSLTMIQLFLFAISALVAGAFFTVWTVQRKADIAVLKAIGASSAYLVRDALGQALILLLAGGALGAAAGAAGGVLLRGSGTPFALDPATVAVPLSAMVVLGLAGAALAVRRIVTVDPLTALGASR
ncbi:FtsX-like permease family protein [Catenulispora pinistramenti]|uniref:FtsX-like permease family protein n=1 Tax=Catenulispora pinistramenti TaxID=2705254 RepID=UPI001BAAEEDF|nr:ABC transporter permease [Catenulispora pinistramenti]